MTGDGWKWLEMFGNGHKIAVNGSTFLEMAVKSWKWLDMAWKLMGMAVNSWTWMEMAGNGWKYAIPKSFAEFCSCCPGLRNATVHDFGIPFTNWHVLLSRHQLGAT